MTSEQMLINWVSGFTIVVLTVGWLWNSYTPAPETVESDSGLETLARGQEELEKVLGEIVKAAGAGMPNRQISEIMPGRERDPSTGWVVPSGCLQGAPPTIDWTHAQCRPPGEPDPKEEPAGYGIATIMHGTEHEMVDQARVPKAARRLVLGGSEQQKWAAELCFVKGGTMLIGHPTIGPWAEGTVIMCNDGEVLKFRRYRPWEEEPEG